MAELERHSGQRKIPQGDHVSVPGFSCWCSRWPAPSTVLSNLSPLFSREPLVSVLLVWQVVPWIMAGFESVVKCVEEATPDFQERDYSVATTLTIVVSAAFYGFVVAPVAYVVPWQTLNHNDPFPTPWRLNERLACAGSSTSSWRPRWWPC